MNRPPRMAELLADDLLLERLSTRMEAGSDPVVPLLAALARHADLPLRAAAPPRRLVRRRALTALTALIVGASGVGVAAAVTGPDLSWPRQSHRVPDPEVSLKVTPAAPHRVAGAGAPAPVSATGGYVLVQDVTRRIGGAPPRVVVSEARPAAPGAAPVFVASPGADGAVAKGEPKPPAQDERDRPARVAPAGDAATSKQQQDADLDDKGEPKRHADAPGSDTVMTLTGLTPAPAGSAPPADVPSHVGQTTDPGREADADDTSRASSASGPKDQSDAKGPVGGTPGHVRRRGGRAPGPWTGTNHTPPDVDARASAHRSTRAARGVADPHTGAPRPLTGRSAPTFPALRWPGHARVYPTLDARGSTARAGLESPNEPRIH